MPAAFGHLSGAWDDPSGSGAEQHGHLAFAQEFIPGVEDAWRVALVAAASGTDFTPRARELGAVTAEIHQSRATLGTEEASPRPTRRCCVPCEAGMPLPLPPCQSWPPATPTSRPCSVGSAPWPGRQSSGSTGTTTSVRCWTCPSAGGSRSTSRESCCGRSPSGSERTSSPRHRRHAALVRLRGRFRASSGQASSDDGPSAWAADCRLAFLDGYGSVAGELDTDDLTLVRVLELDKALYEVDYEARTARPGCRSPAEAVGRILSEKGPAG